MSIPEFILQKLVLPGSLKRTPSGFSFILHNTFAPATITRFGLSVDGIEIQESQITVQESGKSSISASECTPETPLPVPVNQDILVSVISMKPLGLVTIKAVTKEVGPIEFSIEEVKKKKRSRHFSPIMISYFKPKTIAKVTIDTQERLGPASPFLLGQFVEHLERCVYDGIWTADGKELRQDTLDLIKQLNPPMIRYPGGNFASGYHWEDGIGPKSTRPRRHDAAWQAEESNQVGTDEFLTFCESIGTEPYMVVNDGSGTPDEAARWVAYCNSPADTEAGKQRALNGHPQPYGVKYWGVGNEVWGAWQIGTTSADEYVRRLKRFVSAIKAVDPSIKIIAVGNHPLTDDPKNPAALWNKEVLEKAGSIIDYLSWHIYQPEKEGWQENSDDHELFKSICAAPLDIETYINRIQQQIIDAGLDSQVKQALDEWNVWLPPKQGETSMHHVTYTMRDALYAASTLAVLFRNCETVSIANIAQLVNVLPLIQTNDTTAIATSLYFPFILFSQMKEIAVDCKVDSAKFSNQAMGPNISAHNDVPYLDALVSMTGNAEKLTALLINRDPIHRMKVSLNFNPTIKVKPVSSLTIKTDHPLAFNTFANPNRIKITDGKLPIEKKGLWDLTIEPASVNFIEFVNQD